MLLWLSLTLSSAPQSLPPAFTAPPAPHKGETHHSNTAFHGSRQMVDDKSDSILVDEIKMVKLEDRQRIFAAVIRDSIAIQSKIF